MPVHGAAHEGQQALLGVEAGPAQAARFQNDQLSLVLWIAQLNLDAFLGEKLVEGVDHAGIAGQMKAQAGEWKAGEAHIALAAEQQARRRDGLHRRRGAGRTLHPFRLTPLGSGHGEWPEIDVVRGLKTAGQAFDGGLGDQRRAARDAHARGLFALGRVGLALHDGQRGDGAKVAGVDGADEGFADLGEIVVDAAMDPRGEEREAFQQAIDVGIFAALGVEQEPAGNARILARKLPAHLAQIGQLALIVFQQFLAHAATLPRILR